MTIFRVLALVIIVIVACISVLPAKAAEEVPSSAAPLIPNTLKELEGTIWGGDRWISIAGAGGWGPLIAIKILNADSKTVKGLYCWNPKYSPPNCSRFIADTFSEDPTRFKWISRAGNTIDLSFRDGRIIGTRSMNAGGLTFYTMMYSIALQKVDTEPFPLNELEFPAFPADAMNSIDTANLPEPLQRLANRTWEGAWYNSKTKAQAANLRIRMAGYDEKQKLVKVYYAWIYGYPVPSGIREMRGIYEQGKNLIMEDIHRKAINITLHLDVSPENEHIHAIRNLPMPLGYVADFLPIP